MKNSKLVLGLVFILLFISVKNCYSQETEAKPNFFIEGEIKSISGEPIQFANVGLLSLNLGTVSDEKGRFRFILDQNPNSDTLLVSFFSYESKKIPLTMVGNMELEIVLNPKVMELDLVNVEGEKGSQKELGNNSHSKNFSVGFYDNQLGSEIGIEIKTKGKIVSPDSIRIFIAKNDIPVDIGFRVNFYKMEGVEIGEKIASPPVILSISKETGFHSVDLSTFDLAFNEDFLISLEWIYSKGVYENGKGIHFSAGIFNGRTFFKKVNQDDFYFKSGVGLGIKLFATVFDE